MQTAAIKNLILTISSLADLRTFAKRGEFYQQLTCELIKEVQTTEALSTLANGLAAAAHHFYTLRRMDIVDHLSGVLINLPVSRRHESIGSFYRALCLNRQGRSNEARALLEQAADQVPEWYRSRVTMSLGAFAFDSGDFNSALPLYVDAGRTAAATASDLFTIAESHRQIAVIKSVDGDHAGAIADLEKLRRLAYLSGLQYPPVWYGYLNSLAVELAEVGRLKEARNISKVVLASPFSPVYPEWRETFGDITLKQRPASRSFIAIPAQSQTFPVGRPEPQNHVRTVAQSAVPQNLVRLPFPEPFGDAVKSHRSEKTEGRVLDFQQWKTMMKDANAALPVDLASEVKQHMTTGEKLIRLMDLVSRDETDDEMIDRILDAVEEIVAGPQTNIS